MFNTMTMNGQRKSRLRIDVLEDRSLLSTYFVSEAGSDLAAGSLASPFATIQYALNQAVLPGDTVQVRAGTYREKLAFPASGNALAGYITLQAYPGERPVLDGTGVGGDRENMVLLNNISYAKIMGFEIVNLLGVTDGSGIRVTGYGNHLEIRNNIIHEIRGENAMGITVYGTSSRPIDNLIVDGNEIFDAEPAPSEALTLNGNVARFQITGNLVHDVNNIGIDIIGGEKSINRTWGPRYGVVRGNTVFNAHSNYGGGFAAGIYVDGARDILLEYNVSHHNDVGIEVGAENRGRVARAITVRSNLVYLNDKAGIAFGGYEPTAGRVRSSVFTNNTVYKNDTANSGFGQLWIQLGSANVVTNNIFWASDNDVLIASDAGNINNKLTNNLYFTSHDPTLARFTWNGTPYQGLANYQLATKADQYSLFDDPQFVDRDAFDFHLADDSPAIDTGTSVRRRFAPTDLDGLVRPQGNQPDIGAYEYMTVSPVGDGLDADQKRRAEQLISIFENDTIVLQYGYIEALGDGRGYTAGRAGFTTGTGDLLIVVERYSARVPGNALSPYLPRLRELAQNNSSSISGLTGMPQAWQNAASASIFREVQDEVVDEMYYRPAINQATGVGLQNALSKAILYDTIIQHGEGDDPDGLPALIQETTTQLGGSPATGVNERVWVAKFLAVRRAHLLNAFDPSTREEWAESVCRVDVLEAIVTSGNWNLSGPIFVGGDVYTHVTID